MEDHSSTHTFPNLHHHPHRPSLHRSVSSLQSPDVGYPSSQPPLDILEQYGGRGEQCTTPFPTSSTSSAGRRESGGGGRGGLDGDGSLGGHLGGESGSGGHFANTWYSTNIKEEVWDDGESCESTADDLYGKGNGYGNTHDVFYTRNCGREDGRDGVGSFAIGGCNARVQENHNAYVQPNCEAKNDPVYYREANISHLNKQNAVYSQGAAVSFSDSSVDDCRTDGYSAVSDSYLAGEEDFGSSRSSGEEMLPPAELETGTWTSLSPTGQSTDPREAGCRGGADSHAFATGCHLQRSPAGVNSGTYTQKLDSFSEAFFSHRKRGFHAIPGGDSLGRKWDIEAGKRESPGLVKSRRSCAFDSMSDSYLPPSSSPPSHPSLHPLLSPPPPSHLMSSVLSPPPTPLPPPSLSPTKMDSSGAFGGNGHSALKGGESLDALQFFPSRLQSLPSVHPPGMLWKFPLLSHCFPQASADSSSRPSHCSEYNNITAQHNILQTAESSFLTSSSHQSSVLPSRPVSHSSSPSIRPSHHPPPHPSHLSSPHSDAGEKPAPYKVSQEVKNGPLSQSHLKQGALPVYTGTPFPSSLHTSRGKRRGHYTPRPMLNPARKGAGLHSSLSSLHHREETEARREGEEECGVSPCINVGQDFQAELPPCFLEWEEAGAWLPEEESPREQLLWKPWEKLEENCNSQGQVEKLLSLCSSSCLPGGGSNKELALHCLHYCQGDTMATLEMLLFSQCSPTEDYHYSGSDVWTDSERNLFTASLVTYGKDFSLIQKTVRTKTVCQCIEFFYLSKKLLDKQKKQAEEEEEDRDAATEPQTSVVSVPQPMNRQFGLEEAVPVTPLASFFPCKLCGKMFYKIKSRNAHMKIHRQPQEDWSDRRFQHQLLTHRLALSLPANCTPTPGNNLLQPQAPSAVFPSSGAAGTPSSNGNPIVLNPASVANTNSSILDHVATVTYSNVSNPNSHLITTLDTSDSGESQRGPSNIVAFHQSWGSFGLSPEPVTFYSIPEVKEAVGLATGGGKEPVNWQ